MAYTTNEPIKTEDRRVNDIELLLAREQIKTQLYTYCKGVDSCNWAMVKSCFAPEHVHQHNAFTGSVDEFIGFASGTMGKVKASQHSIANMVINLSEDGLSASSEANFHALHIIEADNLPKMHFYKGIVAEGPSVETDWIVAGIYKDKWVFRDGGWLIIQRNASHTWDRVEPSRY